MQFSLSTHAVVVAMKNQPLGVKYIGNLGIKDTTIDIAHYGPRIAGFKYKFNPKGSGIDKVETIIRRSSLSTAPYVIVDDGDYTLEKQNGKWVSTLKKWVRDDYRDET